VSVGSKVAKGDKLLMMEAMKMQTPPATVYAPVESDGRRRRTPRCATLGDTVESKNILQSR
jgi:pyruvate carboxylase